LGHIFRLSGNVMMILLFLSQYIIFYNSFVPRHRHNNVLIFEPTTNRTYTLLISDVVVFNVKFLAIIEYSSVLQNEWKNESNTWYMYWWKLQITKTNKIREKENIYIDITEDTELLYSHDNKTHPNSIQDNIQVI